MDDPEGDPRSDEFRGSAAPAPDPTASLVVDTPVMRAALAQLADALGATVTPSSPPPDDVTRLLWYHDLYKRGVITETDFIYKKRQVLEAPYAPAPPAPPSAPGGGPAK